MKVRDEKAAVVVLGAQIGFGRIMQLAEECWTAVDGDGAHTTGPAAFFLVPCGCGEPHRCEWCCGTGRVTKRVKEAKDGRPNIQPPGTQLREK